MQSGKIPIKRLGFQGCLEAGHMFSSRAPGMQAFIIDAFMFTHPAGIRFWP